MAIPNGMEPIQSSSLYPVQTQFNQYLQCAVMSTQPQSFLSMSNKINSRPTVRVRSTQSNTGTLSSNQPTTSHMSEHSVVGQDNRHTNRPIIQSNHAAATVGSEHDAADICGAILSIAYLSVVDHTSSAQVSEHSIVDLHRMHPLNLW